MKDFSYHLEEKLSRIRCLSGNMIKVIAIALMFFDHFCKIILTWYSTHTLAAEVEAGMLLPEHMYAYDQFVRFTLQPIGKIAFPLFCFMIAEGYFYTHSKQRYFLFMGGFAILTEPIFDIAFFGDWSRAEGTYPFFWQYQNVLFTLLLGLFALWLAERVKICCDNKLPHVGVVILQLIVACGMAICAELLHTDYGFYGVILIVGFYWTRQNRLYQILALFVIYMLCENAVPTLSLVISALILLMYNGKRGKWNMKYFFYVFYPGHILLLHMMTFVIAYLCY